MQIVSLFAGIAYQMVVWWKGSLNIFDGVVLIAIYAAYLWIMRRLPPRGSGDARRDLGRAASDCSGIEAVANNRDSRDCSSWAARQFFWWPIHF